MTTTQLTQKENKNGIVYARESYAVPEVAALLDSQVSECIKFAQDLGYTVVAVEREIHTALELYERTVFSRVRHAIRAGEYGALVFHAIDPIARDSLHLALIAADCARVGCKLVCVIDQIDTSPQGQDTLQSMGHAAHLEVEKIVERTLRGKRRRALEGRIHGAGPELYGYRRDKESGVRVIVKREAAIVRAIFKWVTREHIGAAAVARRLNQLNVPPPSAGKMRFPDPSRKPRWTKTQVQRMLRNPAYKGESFAWRTQRPVNATNRQQKAFDTSEGRVIRPREQWIKLPDDVTPAIVTPDTWQAAQEGYEERKALAAKRDAKRRYLLRGMVRCGVCGTAMYSNVEAAGTTRRARVYRCSSREKAQGACGGSRINADAVEAWVWSAVGALLCEPQRLQVELACRQRRGLNAELTGDLETAYRQIANYQEKQVGLMAEYSASVDGSFLREFIKREIESIEVKIVQWQELAEEIEMSIRDKTMPLRQLETLLEHLTCVGQDLDSFGFEERRMAFEALQVRVEGNGREWTLYCSLPTEDGGEWSQTHKVRREHPITVSDEIPCACGETK